MSNTRTNRRQPLGPIEHNRRQMLGQPPGQQEAVMLAAALGLALDQAGLAPGCARCVRREKAAGVAEPQIRQAVTWQDGEPVCWDDFEVRP